MLVQLLSLIPTLYGTRNYPLRYAAQVRRWLGDGFALGREEYVSNALTVKDLLAHRSGLAEGQGDIMGYLYPASEQAKHLPRTFLEPSSSLPRTLGFMSYLYPASEQVRAPYALCAWCLVPHTLPAAFVHTHRARLYSLHPHTPFTPLRGA